MQRTPGDPQVVDWERVLEKHRSWLRTVVRARLGEAGAVDEVLQEVSLAAIRHQHSLADRSKVAPWLYRIAIRQALLFRRKQGRIRKLNHSYAERVRADDVDQREPDLLGWMLTRERRSMVREALKRLPRRDTEVLLLKYTEGWNYDRIAEHLGLSYSATAHRLRRARKRLRGELARLQVNEDDA